MSQAAAGSHDVPDDQDRGRPVVPSAFHLDSLDADPEQVICEKERSEKIKVYPNELVAVQVRRKKKVGNKRIIKSDGEGKWIEWIERIVSG